MLQEAGKKTGSAIGNRLFKKSTDYIRVGELDGSSSRQSRTDQMILMRRQAKMDRQTELMNEVLRMDFDARDIRQNLAVLAQLASVLDSLPNRFNRSDFEQQIFKMAKSKMESGIVICKSIDRRNTAIMHFENKLLGAK
ncbi:MAG: hypothetical protein IJG35_03330 [Bacteroidales bacterium]|nr:hypothetical protein [Bacteroidales bacterium]